MNEKFKWLLLPALLLPLAAWAMDADTFKADCEKARADSATYKKFKKSVFRHRISSSGEATRMIDAPMREPRVVIEDANGIAYTVATMEEVANWMSIGKTYEFTGEIDYIEDCDSLEIVNPDWSEVTE